MDRVRTLEEFVRYTKFIIAFFALAGISLAGSFAYVVANVIDADGQIKKINDHYEVKIMEFDNFARKKVNDDILITSFSSDGVLAQIQAQSICASMIEPSKLVVAVLRGLVTAATDRDEASSLKCSRICKEQSASVPNVGRPTKYIGGVHVYGDKPPFRGANQINTSGLITHTYSSGQDPEKYGPNYCCCST